MIAYPPETSPGQTSSRQSKRGRRLWPLAGAGTLVVALVGGGIIQAQLAPGDRGVPPLDSSSDLEVSNVAVDVSGKTAEQARMGGWREAQRKAWKVLYARIHGVSPDDAPGLPDSTLDSIVAGIEVENEQIGPTRYIGKLGILFDRSRTAGFLGGAGDEIVRSQPMLVMPVEFSGGAGQVFERKTEWQRAWARFHAGASAIDYVRPVGDGADPVVLNLGQTGRRGRGWWRLLLDQYGAADIVMPEVHVHRLWPGGPVRCDFVARHGPDGEVLGTFSLFANDDSQLDATLDQGVKRIDDIYSNALRSGALAPDDALTPPPAPVLPQASTTEDQSGEDPLAQIISDINTQDYVIQVDTPDAAALDAAQAALKALPGMHSVSVGSLAMGGVSLLKASFEGDRDTLVLAIQSHGWRAEDAGGAIRIRRGGGGGSGGGAPGATTPANPPTP